MAGIRPYAIGMVIVILAAIALIQFQQGFMTINNPNSTIQNNAQVNTTLNAFKNQTTALENLGNDTVNTANLYQQPSITNIFLITEAAFYIPLKMLKFLVGASANLITLPFIFIFGASQGSFYIISGALTAIILITIAVLAIRGIRIGETER